MQLRMTYIIDFLDSRSISHSQFNMLTQCDMDWTSPRMLSDACHQCRINWMTIIESKLHRNRFRVGYRSSIDCYAITVALFVQLKYPYRIMVMVKCARFEQLLLSSFFFLSDWFEQSDVLFYLLHCGFIQMVDYSSATSWNKKSRST